MGSCIYCGQKAGFLRNKHNECAEAYRNGKNEIIESIFLAITNRLDFDVLENTIKHITSSCYIKQDEVEALHAYGFNNAVESILNNGILTAEDEEKFTRYRSHYCFEQDILDKNGGLQRLAKASILRVVLDGGIPDTSVAIHGHLPFLFQKAEKILWVFQRVELYEQRTKTTYQGKSRGVSVRISKGIYYKVGAFKGKPVSIQETKCTGVGLVALTNKHIYFASSTKNFKIPYSKIVVVNPYENGVEIQKDGANTKPMLFKGLDAWFTYNIICNLNG